jgi:hypothetical protein
MREIVGMPECFRFCQHPDDERRQEVAARCADAALK